MILTLLVAKTETKCQTVSGYDAVVTGAYNDNKYHLIGTYQGWDPECVYVAGYNYYNNSALKTRRVKMGGIVTDLQSGYVGINTASPAAYLNVASPATSTVASLKFGVPGDKGNLAVPKGAAAGGYNIDFAGWRDISTDFVGARIRAERINDWVDNSALSQGVDLAFFAGGSSTFSERLRIKYNGNVGIGTSNPTAKLAVNGTVKAREVNVTVNTADWPDYVFSRGYRLPHLDSLAAGINQLGHLPGIPSAMEAEKNGVNLGEMNRKLLEKVEELTLLLIEQGKKTETLQQENREMQLRVQKLEDTSKKQQD